MSRKSVYACGFVFVLASCSGINDNSTSPRKKSEGDGEKLDVTIQLTSSNARLLASKCAIIKGNNNGRYEFGGESNLSLETVLKQLQDSTQIDICGVVYQSRDKNSEPQVTDALDELCIGLNVDLFEVIPLSIVDEDSEVWQWRVKSCRNLDAGRGDMQRVR